MEASSIHDHDLILAYFETHMLSAMRRLGPSCSNFWSDMWNDTVAFVKWLWSLVQLVSFSVGWSECWNCEMLLIHPVPMNSLVQQRLHYAADITAGIEACIDCSILHSKFRHRSLPQPNLNLHLPVVQNA
jgi:hypothetical protein